MRLTLILMAAVLSFADPARPQPPASGAQCSAVSFTIKLEAGQSFAERVGNLEFKLRASHGNGLCGGWTFTLEASSGYDFIYPVNFPLRFNPSQLLGCSYGLTVRQGLEMERSMQFILTGRDYVRLRPLMEDALWPADSADPERAGDKYLNAVRAVQTGVLRLRTLRYELSPGGLIRSATFRVEMVAPTSFHFAPPLEPHPVACPATPAR